MTLSIAIKGARSKISKEVKITIRLGNHKVRCTVQVVILDKWDIILGMPFLSAHHAIISIGKNISVYLPPLQYYMEIIQQDEKIGNRSLSCEPVENPASHTKNFDPIKEFPDVFPEEPSLKLPPLRKGFDCRINLIDENKKMNPAVIPVPPKWMTHFLQKIQQDLQAGRFYTPQAQLRQPVCSVCLSQANQTNHALSPTSDNEMQIQSETIIYFLI